MVAASRCASLGTRTEGPKSCFFCTFFTPFFQEQNRKLRQSARQIVCHNATHQHHSTSAHQHSSTTNDRKPTTTTAAIINNQQQQDSKQQAASSKQQAASSNQQLRHFHPCTSCHLLLCHLCICVHFRIALESQAKRCLHICHHIGLHRFAHCAINRFTLVAEQVTAHFIDPRPAACTHRIAAQRACVFQAVNRIYLRASDPSLFAHCVAMASSAVSSVLYLRDAGGNHSGTRTGACIYHGDAASFHEWEFRTRLRIASKTGDDYIEAMSKVYDGLRGDAFVAAQEVGFDSLCEIID